MNEIPLNFTFCVRCGEQMNPKHDASAPPEASADVERIVLAISSALGRDVVNGGVTIFGVIRHNVASIVAERDAAYSKGYTEASKDMTVIMSEHANAIDAKRMVEDENNQLRAEVKELRAVAVEFRNHLNGCRTANSDTRLAYLTAISAAMQGEKKENT